MRHAQSLRVQEHARQAHRLPVRRGHALAGQAPWLVSGLLHAGAAVTDGEGAALFALSDGLVKWDREHRKVEVIPTASASCSVR